MEHLIHWIGLRENNYRKAPYFMGKSTVSCRFSLKPVHWPIERDDLGVHSSLKRFPKILRDTPQIIIHFRLGFSRSQKPSSYGATPIETSHIFAASAEQEAIAFRNGASSEAWIGFLFLGWKDIEPGSNHGLYMVIMTRVKWLDIDIFQWLSTLVRYRYGDYD